MPLRRWSEIKRVWSLVRKTASKSNVKARTMLNRYSVLQRLCIADVSLESLVRSRKLRYSYDLSSHLKNNELIKYLEMG